jgi:hypothetical protein
MDLDGQFALCPAANLECLVIYSYMVLLWVYYILKGTNLECPVIYIYMVLLWVYYIIKGNNRTQHTC